MTPRGTRRWSPSGARAAALVVFAALAVLALLPRTSSAQLSGIVQRDTAGAERRVEGRIVRPGAAESLAVPGIWVVLHRVGSDAQGPLDSMRTTPSGVYRFRYRARGDDAIYFVSASYGGLAYFSPPLRGAVVSGDDAEIVVYDTTSSAVAIAVRGHHIVVSAPADGTREIIEVYELSNDTTVTFVSPSPSAPSWSTLLPDGARSPALREGDIGADAVEFEEGRVKVYAPIAPGLRQIAYSYRLPDDVLPISIPVEHHAEVLEVLVEAPRAEVSGARLERTDPVSVEGRNFSRFLADETPANAVVRVDLADAAESGKGVWIPIVLIAVGAAMLLALARVALRPRRI